MNVRDVMERELKAFKDNPDAWTSYTQGIALLRKSGIFEILRTLARPFAIEKGANPNQSAYMAAFVEGYNTAIDDVKYFEEMYLNDLSTVKGIEANFGAVKIALDKGFITKEDIVNGKRTSK